MRWDRSELPHWLVVAFAEVVLQAVEGVAAVAMVIAHILEEAHTRGENLARYFLPPREDGRRFVRQWHSLTRIQVPRRKCLCRVALGAPDGSGS